VRFKTVVDNCSYTAIYLLGLWHDEALHL